MRFVLTFILFVSSAFAFGQSGERFEFIQADHSSLGNYQGQKVKVAKGNVEFHKGDIYLYCDSAYYFDDCSIMGWGEVRIIKAGSKPYTLTGNSVIYDWKKNRATVEGNVFLRYKKREKRRQKIRFKLR